MAKAKALTLDQLRSAKKPVVRTVDIFLDFDVSMAIAVLDVEHEEATRAALARPSDVEAQDRAVAAKAALDAARQSAVDEGQVASFAFRGIARKRFERLKEEHPPTEEQQKKAKAEALGVGLPPDKLHLARLNWNPDTFVPALIAEASLDPKISYDEAYELCHVSEDWNDAEIKALFECALDAQRTRGAADLGKWSSGSAPTPS